MEKNSFDEIFDQIKRLFYLIGMPLKKPKLCLRYYLFLCSLIVTVLQEILFFSSKFNRDNFFDLTQLAPCICVGTLSIIKIIFIANKRDRIVQLSDSLRKLYQIALKDSKQYNVIRKDFIFLKYLVKYFFLLNAILICIYNFSSFFILFYYYYTKKEIVLRLPYAVLVPFSTDPWYAWTFVYLHSIISGFICVAYFTSVDALYFTLTTHTCSQFTLLSSEIIKLDESNAKNLNVIIKKHQYILKLASDLEKIFDGPNLFNVLVGSLEICVLGFNLIVGQWAQLPGVILFLLSVLVQMLMVSVFGENLIQESKKIGDAAFLCKWYKMDRTSKKSILLLILRSQRPCVLTAYSYAVISYESFTKIISTSWSYFTILRTMFTPGNN